MEGRQSYKRLWAERNRKQRLEIEILRRTPTFKRLFDAAFTLYLQSAYGHDSDISAIKADPDIRTMFVEESFEGRMLTSAMELPVLVDADVSIKVPEIAYYKSTTRLMHTLAGTKPSSEENQRDTLRICTPKHAPPEASKSDTRGTPKIMDTLRNSRYLTIEIDLQNPQEDIRASIDFWVFDVFWKGVTSREGRKPRSIALNDEDLEIYDLKTSRESILKIARKRNPKIKSKSPNEPGEARTIYRRLLSRNRKVKILIEQENERLKALMKTDQFIIDMLAQVEGNQPPSASPKPTVAEVKEMIMERESRLDRPQPGLRPMRDTED